jgi:quercetin dioxygenase-like cupin family protein
MDSMNRLFRSVVFRLQQSRRENAMKVCRSESVDEKPVEMEGAAGCTVRWLVGAPDGAPNFAMRQFTVEPGGHTPRHRHPYEHEVYVLEGAGTVREGDRDHPIAPGDVVYVAPDEVHQFRNTGPSPLKFLCLVPNSAATGKVTVVPECGIEP